MPPLTLVSPSRQVAEHLRGELLRGAWGGEIPGAPLLAAELEIDRKTVDAALRLLEEEGLLVPQGVGKRRRIVIPAGKGAPSMRVAILIDEPSERRMVCVGELQHELEEAGHTVLFVERPKGGSKMKQRSLARTVERAEADAWVVLSGSREELEWFSSQEIPTSALFGRMRRLPIAGAGPDKGPAYATAARTLVGLGHRRIVLLVRPRRRLPKPGAVEQAFLDELASHGLPVSDYNLPAWEETIEGFHGRLESLFRLTPPTALVIDEAPLFSAAQQFLARLRLRVPEDVSLVCTDADPAFGWSLPPISHIRWDGTPVVRRVLKWASNISLGKPDTSQLLTPAEFVPGGTIGPATGL